jgi:hypothetical protein
MDMFETYHGRGKFLHSSTLNREMWGLRRFAGHDPLPWGPTRPRVPEKINVNLRKATELDRK